MTSRFFLDLFLHPKYSLTSNFKHMAKVRQHCYHDQIIEPRCQKKNRSTRTLIHELICCERRFLSLYKHMQKKCEILWNSCTSFLNIPAKFHVILLHSLHFLRVNVLRCRFFGAEASLPRSNSIQCLAGSDDQGKMAANKKTPPGLQQSNIIMPHILRLGLHPNKEVCFLLHKWGCGEERREKKPEGRYGIFIGFLHIT